MTMLRAENISVEAGGRRIVRDVSFNVGEGDKMMIVGPNGAGKTTLIRALMHAVPHTGRVALNGRDIASFKPLELARNIGVLTQSHYPQFAYTVRDVVSLGRYAYRKGLLSGPDQADKASVERAMALTGVTAMAGTSIQTLSGGELQRVFLAQLFAQDPAVLILDEPTNNLDLSFQITVFDIIDEWVRQPGRAVIAVIHDLNMVYKYASKVLLMHGGERYAFGPPEEALSPENLNSVYDVDIAGWMKGLLRHWEGKPC